MYWRIIRVWFRSREIRVLMQHARSKKSIPVDTFYKEDRKLQAPWAFVKWANLHLKFPTWAPRHHLKFEPNSNFPHPHGTVLNCSITTTSSLILISKRSCRYMYFFMCSVVGKPEKQQELGGHLKYTSNPSQCVLHVWFLWDPAEICGLVNVTLNILYMQRHAHGFNQDMSVYSICVYQPFNRRTDCHPVCLSVHVPSRCLSSQMRKTVCV